MSSLFSKALVYLGLVDEDQIDETDDNGHTAQPHMTPMEPVERRPLERREAEPIGLGRRVEPPPTSRTAIRPASRSEMYDVGTIRPVEMHADILLVEDFGDARILADRVRARTPVVLDLRSADQDLTRRVVDFSSGLIYALDGSMRKVGDGLVLVLPPRVVLSRDEKRRLASLGAYHLDDVDD